MSRNPSTVASPGTARPMIDWGNEPTSMVAERAARRAIEAISRCGTLNADVASLTERVALLEASNHDLLEAMLAMIGP